MNESRFFPPLAAADFPLSEASPSLPGVACEMDWPESWGSTPAIRLQPSEAYAGSSVETDRIIHRWRPRICNLVDQANSMAGDLCEISWNGSNEGYPTCHFLKLIGPVGRDLRPFCDATCQLLLEVRSKDEIMAEVFWPDHRRYDARDVREWMDRWGAWLPDAQGQFHLWSIFMDCDALEALYRYVHALVHDFYLEILELHREWEAERAQEIASGDALPDIHAGPLNSIIYWHPRLLLDDREFILSTANAEQMRDWAYNAFVNWKRRIPKEQQESLFMLGYEADKLCPDPRWQD